MACSSCSSGGGCGKPGGCSSGGCATGGCNRLNVFDWFGDLQLPVGQRPFDIVEVRFKGTRKEFYRLPLDVEVYTGEPVIVEGGTARNFDLGTISMRGELVKLQLKKKKLTVDDEFRKVMRIASPEDLARAQLARDREQAMLEHGRSIIEDMRMEMKLSDVEVQGDGQRATFYYSSEERIDFRQLLRQLNDAFNVQINMRQIGLRQEAGRIGGIGSCGRELCCSTWLTEFKQVTTSAARYQNLALNSAKLSGQCGRLKCCLNFELDVYVDALKAFPKADKLETEAGRAFLQKTDIFRRAMVYFVKATNQYFTLPPERAAFILAENKEGRKPASLDDASIPIPMGLAGDLEAAAMAEPEIVFEDAEGEGSLNRFERSKRGGGKTKAKLAQTKGKRPDDNRRVDDSRRGATNPAAKASAPPPPIDLRGPRPAGEVRQTPFGKVREERQPRENREPREPRLREAPSAYDTPRQAVAPRAEGESRPENQGGQPKQSANKRRGKNNRGPNKPQNDGQSPSNDA